MATAKKLPSGSWRVNLYIGKDANGKRKYKSFTADTKKKAEYLAAQYNELRLESSSSSITLKTAAEEYIKSKENVMSPSTIRSYRAIVRNDVPELMNTKIKDITERQAQSAFNVFAANHTPKTCRNVHNLVSAVLKMYRPGFALNTTLPPRSKRGIYVPDSEEVSKIWDLVRDSEIEIPFLLATQCGLRASEISGLDVSSVYEDHIEIKQARVRGEKGEVLKAPKSYAGFRKIPICAELSAFLREKSVENRVFPYSSNWITCHWKTFRDKNHLPEHLNFHALRHHFPSKCLLMGMPQKYIAEIMGHSSVNMIERVYQHIFPSAMEQYAGMLREQNKEFMQHEKQHDKPQN